MLHGQRTLVVGMARSGLAAVRFLRDHGVPVTAADSQPLESLPEAAKTLAEAGVPFRLATAEALAECELVVLSPGVPNDSPLANEARQRGIPVTGEVELAAAYLQGPIIGITGSNGKTTTTALIGHLLRESGVPVQVGGNIGVPVTAMVATSRPGQWNVLELSSFQLETVETMRASIGVCLNVTPDHLDRHYTFEGYARAKQRLFDTMHGNGRAVLNADDATCVRFGAATRATVSWFSTSRSRQDGAWLQDQHLYLQGEPLLARAELPLVGLHNVENALAASLAAHFAGASTEGIAAALRSFRAVEHRLELVRERAGVRWFNDSKATNVDATLKALDAFPGHLWVILGGKDKGSDYSVLRAPLQTKARAAILIGAAAGKIGEQLQGAVPLVESGNLARAVEYADQMAEPGDTVLLAPACASFDQFQNFEHRGRVFKQLVCDLPDRTA